MVREILVYVPADDHRATSGIAQGSAIVGRPEPRADDVQIYYEGGVRGQSEMRTLADRAVYASGRLIEEYPTTATRVVPRDALTVVGTFDPSSSRIMLTGSTSEAAVAAWLGTPVLDPAELKRERPRPLSAVEVARLAPDFNVAVNESLGLALIQRGGLRREAEIWVAPDGRRTSATAEALIWALALIADET